jgi:archaellum component FlaC
MDAATELEQQLQEALKTRAEFEIQLQNLKHTPGATKEQINLLEKRLKDLEREIERIREQQKKLRR